MAIDLSVRKSAVPEPISRKLKDGEQLVSYVILRSEGNRCLSQNYEAVKQEGT